MNFPNVKYRSGVFAVATPISLPVFGCPFSKEGINIPYVLTQDFWQLQDNFAPLALDTPHPDFPDYILVSEGQSTDMKGGVRQWTRTYAKVPDSFSRPGGEYSYLFPAFVTGSALTNRNAKNLVVGLRTQYDFKLTGNPYVDLPTTPAQRWVLAGNADVDAVDSQGQPALTSNTLPGVAFTVPTYQDYKDVWIPNGREFVPKAAAPEVWMGNIYWRRTLLIPAT